MTSYRVYRTPHSCILMPFCAHTHGFDDYDSCYPTFIFYMWAWYSLCWIVSTSYRPVVRTLDFHSNNAGSNPASSKITNHLLRSNSNSAVSTQLRYEFSFISLLPLLCGKAKFRYERLESNLSDKIFLKRSYLVFLWLNYLASYQNDTYTVKVTKIQPRTKLYTVVKAPMAHKTNSKEQFISKHYHFKVQFTVKRSSFVYSPTGTRRLVNVSLIESFPIFETNLLFLMSTKIHTPLRLTKYFTR